MGRKKTVKFADEMTPAQPLVEAEKPKRAPRKKSSAVKPKDASGTTKKPRAPKTTVIGKPVTVRRKKIPPIGNPPDPSKTFSVPLGI